MRAPMQSGVDFSESDSDSESDGGPGRGRADTAMSVESDFDPEEASRLRAAWAQMSAPVAPPVFPPAAAAPSPAPPAAAAPAEVPAAAERLSLKGVVEARTMESTPSGTWHSDHTHCLGSVFEDQFLGKAVFFNSVSSVDDAARRLNSGELQCEDGICIVFSQSRDLIFLLWRGDRREVALKRFNVDEEASNLSSALSEIDPIALEAPSLARDDSLFRLGPSSLLAAVGPGSPRTPGTKTKSKDQELAERGLASANTMVPSDNSDSEASSLHASPVATLASSRLCWEKISDVLGAVRGVPEAWTRVLFLEMLDGMGFTGQYDCVYMPVDANRQCNFGYAFVTTSSPEAAEKVAAALEVKTHLDFPSPEDCDLSWQSADHGLRAPRMAACHAKPETEEGAKAAKSKGGECRPLWFVGGECVEEPPALPQRTQRKAG